MHPTERGKVITAAGLVVAARVMVTKRGNRIGICTLDDRSGRLEVMLFTDHSCVFPYHPFDRGTTIRNQIGFFPG